METASRADERFWGLPEGWLDGEDDVDAGVWPEHEEAVRAFLSISTQWRTVALPSGRQRVTGLDYTAVEAGFRLARHEIEPEIWAQVRIIEQGAKEALNA